MADESKTGNPNTLERQDAEIEGADETIEAERTGPGGDLTKLTTTAPKKKNKKVTKGFMGWKIKAAERKKKKKEQQQDKEDKEKREKQLGKKFVERVRAKKLGDQVREEGELTHLKEEKYGKEYENEQWKLNFKINFIIEQIEDLDRELATKLKSGDEGAITQLISIEEGAEPINKLKLKLANCLKELGSMMNLRESKQIQRINEYIKSLKDVNDIFKINQYVNDDDKIPEDMNFEDKICQKDDNTETCKKKLEEALGMFEQFKVKMTKALESQNENETKFQKMKEDGEKFKTDFGKWMDGLNELGNEPIEKLNGLKDTIQGYQINEQLLGDEKDLKANMLNEIGILIKTIGEYKQYEEELKAEKKNMEQAQINLDAAKAVETSAQVAAVAKEEEAQKDKGGDSDDGGPSSEVETALNNPLSREFQSGDEFTSGDTVDPNSPPQIISGKAEVSKEDESETSPVKKVLETGETDEEVARKKRHEQIEKLKETQLPAGLKRSQSEVQTEVIPSSEEGGLTKMKSSPGEIGKDVEDVEVEPISTVKREVKKINKKTKKLEKNEVGSSVISPEATSAPPLPTPTGMPKKIIKADAKATLSKSDLKTVGGRKKKSRRRKKSKKRKSKKNRR